MTAGRGWRVLSMTLVPLLMPIAVPPVSQLETGERTLRGLAGVAVVAESVAPELKPYGVTDDWLRDEIATRVAAGGLAVIHKGEALEHPRQPLLVARLQTTRVPERTAWAWHLSVALHQRMMTVADTLSVTDRVQSWTARGTLGITSGSRLRDSVLDAIEAQVGEFVGVWRGRKG
jgi:hypothetical protein